MKRIMKLLLAVILYGFSPTTIMAQELAVAASPDTGVNKFITCQIINSDAGCEIFFVRFEGDVKSDKEKRKFLPATLLKEYKVSSADNSITEIDLSKEDMLETKEKIKQDRDTEKPKYRNVSFILDRQGSKMQEMSTTNECILPVDLPDGDYIVNVSWDWIPAKSEEKKPDTNKASAKRTSFNFVYSPKRDTEIKLKENPVVKKK